MGGRACGGATRAPVHKASLTSAATCAPSRHAAVAAAPRRHGGVSGRYGEAERLVHVHGVGAAAHAAAAALQGRYSPPPAARTGQLEDIGTVTRQFIAAYRGVRCIEALCGVK